MRVVTGGISHETSTFTTVITNLQSYKDRFYLHGDQILNMFHGTNSPIGGFIDGAKTHGFELIPTVLATAQPSGPTPRDLFDAILDELLNRIADVGSIEGVLLSLHGSMAVGNLDQADGIDDAEGYILAAVRQLVGPDVPILVQLDIHSNVSQRMVDQASVLIGRKSYPEVDMAERSQECADILMRILKDGVCPTMALHQIPMFWGMNQVTAYSPMREAIAELHRVTAQPGVICGSIATCYYLADVPNMGSSVYIVTDNDQNLAQMYADQLGAWLFERRTEWHCPLLSTFEALQEAKLDGRYPVIFADVWDNTGGGSPGDSTGMLRTFIEAGLRDACVLYIVDPESIVQCQEAGVGTKLMLDVGGKSSLLQGNPIPMKAEVVALSDGYFHYDGPFSTYQAGWYSRAFGHSA
ncbi:TPA: M81 family peptidase [Candidatus Poribacteria bacterium]|nr:M81 family peptidase [Candidatus Poribacteria bacterium]